MCSRLCSVNVYLRVMANQGWKPISSFYCVICILYYGLVISNQLQKYQLRLLTTLGSNCPITITITITIKKLPLQHL